MSLKQIIQIHTKWKQGNIGKIKRTNLKLYIV
jgi:hypothetical protein